MKATLLADDRNTTSDTGGEELVSRFTGVLPEIVVGPVLDRLAGELLGTLLSEHHKRKLGVFRFDRLEEFESVDTRHLVIADDAVNPAGRFEMIKHRLSIGLRMDLEAVFAFEITGHKIRESIIIVDEEYGY
jgi:hypothetical protein